MNELAALTSGFRVVYMASWQLEVAARCYLGGSLKNDQAPQKIVHFPISTTHH